MKAQQAKGTLVEHVSAGWWGGNNSIKIPWLMPDTQYRWSVNAVNRGGIIQTRPGYYLRLVCPAGNFQGFKVFKTTKSDSTVDDVMMFAVDGKVYYTPFVNGIPVQQTDWDSFRLTNIQFDPAAKRIYWCVAQKSLSEATTGTLSFVPTYSVMIMQDGTSAAAYYDGKDHDHLDESAPAQQTPTGTWMSWTGNRLWIARENAVIACDLGDPLSARERTSGTGRGDFRFNGTVTGFANTTGDNRQSNLAVFTENNTSTLQAGILNRDLWGTTTNFQSLLYEKLGCVAGLSIISHAGLLWWYSHGGLVNSDSAAASFLTSRVRYRDIEEGNCKRNLSDDLTNICSGSFGGYLLVSVPSGDTLNSQTMVLDYAIADELAEEAPPAWNGVWTGTRPIQWETEAIGGRERIYQASIDYQALDDGSFNHIWEAFQADRMDSYEVTDVNNTRQVIKNKIYASWESKLLGDGMDYKRFKFAELDLCEIGGEVNIKVSYGGSKGGYTSILEKKIIATMDAESSDNDDLQELAARAVFKTQSRRVRTTEADIESSQCADVESKYPDSIDKYFGLYVQWCGRMGIESIRLYTEPIVETSSGACEVDETGINVVTEDGTGFKLE